MRIQSCTREVLNGRDQAFLEVDVVFSFYDDVRRRRKLQQDEGDDSDKRLMLLRVGVDSADPRGLWYRNALAKSIVSAADDLGERIGNRTIEMNITARQASDADKPDVARGTGTRISNAFNNGVDSRRLGQQEVFLQANHEKVAHRGGSLAKTATSSTPSNSSWLFMGVGGSGGTLLAAQERAENLAASVETATRTVDDVNALMPDAVVGCRAPNGALLVYYNVSARGIDEIRGSEATRVNSRREPVRIAPYASAVKAGRRDIQPSRRRLHFASSRKMLRDAPPPRQLVSRSDGNDDGNAWKGYARYAGAEDDANFVRHKGYTRPRTFGATGQLRVIGGVLITQRRAAVAVGCRDLHVRAGLISLGGSRGRFTDLSRDMPCSSHVADSAYGFDPMFTRLDLPKGAMDPATTLRANGGLYKPSLHDVREAFYNEVTELTPVTPPSTRNVPFGFFPRDYDNKNSSIPRRQTVSSTNIESALYDVYLDGTLTRESASRLLSYLHFSRFVDRRSRLIDIRVLMYSAASEILVDARVNMRVNAHGEVHSSTEIWKVPLFDYFDGTPENVGLFVFEILIGALALVLCASSIGDARRFAHLLHDSVMRRLQQHISHRHFIVDASMIMVEAMQLAIPICLLAASVVHFVYFFAYVRSFTYERNYRWYDGDGSAEARILLPKRLADPQPPVEGYPRGAWRHNLPVDLSERDAYLALLDKVDVMSTLNGWYLVLQVPILLGIAANIVRHIVGLPTLYPYMRTLQRGIPDFLTLIGTTVLCTTLHAYALHLLIGYRTGMFRSARRAVESLSAYTIGDVSGLLYQTNTGTDQNVIVEQVEQVVVALVHIIYPLITVFVLMHFVVAILLDFFVEERHRRLAKDQLQSRRETADQKLARRAMRTYGHFDWARDMVSAILYSLTLNNTAAFMFSSNVKWMDPRRRLRGFAYSTQQQSGGGGTSTTMSSKEEGIVLLGWMHNNNSNGINTTAQQASSGGGGENPTFGGEKETPQMQKYVRALIDSRKTVAVAMSANAKSPSSNITAMERWRRVRELVRQVWLAEHMLGAIVKQQLVGSRGGLTEGGDSKSKDRTMATRLTSGGHVRTKGLQNDTARYLRMNQADRQELIVPVIGMIGPTALAEVLHGLHDLAIRLTSETAHRRTLSIKDADYYSHEPGTFTINLELVQNNNEPDDDEANKDAIDGGLAFKVGVEDPADNALKPSPSKFYDDDSDLVAVTEMQNLLYRFASENERARLASKTEHLSEAKFRDITQVACLSLSRRVVHDLGWRAGTEFNRLSGDALMDAVLRRARDTSKGMAAVISDMMGSSAALPQVVQMVRDNEGTRARRPQQRRSNSIFRLPAGLSSKLLSMRRGDIVESTWRLGTSAVQVVTEVPWRMSGVLLKVLCGGEAPPLVKGNSEHIDWDETSRNGDTLRRDRKDARRIRQAGRSASRKRMINDILMGGD